VLIEAGRVIPAGQCRIGRALPGGDRAGARQVEQVVVAEQARLGAGRHGQRRPGSDRQDVVLDRCAGGGALQRNGGSGRLVDRVVHDLLVQAIGQLDAGNRVRIDQVAVDGNHRAGVVLAAGNADTVAIQRVAGDRARRAQLEFDAGTSVVVGDVVLDQCAAARIDAVGAAIDRVAAGRRGAVEGDRGTRGGGLVIDDVVQDQRAAHLDPVDMVAEHRAARDRAAAGVNAVAAVAVDHGIAVGQHVLDQRGTIDIDAGADIVVIGTALDGLARALEVDAGAQRAVDVVVGEHDVRVVVADEGTVIVIQRPVVDEHAVLHGEIGHIGVVGHVEAGLQVAGEYVVEQHHGAGADSDVDAVIGAAQRQVLEFDVAGANEVEHIGARGGVVPVQHRGRAGQRRPQEQDRLGGGAGIRRRQDDVARQRVAAAVDLDGIARKDRVGAQQRGQAGNRLAGRLAGIGIVAGRRGVLVVRLQRVVDVENRPAIGDQELLRLAADRAGYRPDLGGAAAAVVVDRPDILALAVAVDGDVRRDLRVVQPVGQHIDVRGRRRGARFRRIQPDAVDHCPIIATGIDEIEFQRFRTRRHRDGERLADRIVAVAVCRQRGREHVEVAFERRAVGDDVEQAIAGVSRRRVGEIQRQRIGARPDRQRVAHLLADGGAVDIGAAVEQRRRSAGHRAHADIGDDSRAVADEVRLAGAEGIGRPVALQPRRDRRPAGVQQQDRLRGQQALGLDVDRQLLADLVFRHARGRQDLDALRGGADLGLRRAAVIAQVDAPAIGTGLQQIRRGGGGARPGGGGPPGAGASRPGRGNRRWRR
jgi:hypothetical protein